MPNKLGQLNTSPQLSPSAHTNKNKPRNILNLVLEKNLINQLKSEPNTSPSVASTSKTASVASPQKFDLMALCQKKANKENASLAKQQHKQNHSNINSTTKASPVAIATTKATFPPVVASDLTEDDKLPDLMVKTDVDNKSVKSERIVGTSLELEKLPIISCKSLSVSLSRHITVVQNKAQPNQDPNEIQLVVRKQEEIYSGNVSLSVSELHQFNPDLDQSTPLPHSQLEILHEAKSEPISSEVILQSKSLSNTVDYFNIFCVGKAIGKDMVCFFFS